MKPLFAPELRTLLHDLHAQQAIKGLEEFAREHSNGTRTIYRWHRHLGTRLVYYPHLAYAAFGLAHAHLFITDPANDWASFPYAIESAWLRTSCGDRVLYLHCLLPPGVRDRLAGVTTINSGDGWQALADLHTALDRDGRPCEHDPVTIPELRAGETALLSAYPFLLPVICELVGQRRSMHDVWHAILSRLGQRVWEYLPRRTRRWTHNGKTYIKWAYQVLNEHGIVRQHVVRYQPLAEHTIEVFLHSEDPDAGVLLHEIGRVAPVLERYPTAHGYLVRVIGDHRLLKRLARTRITCTWWLASDEPAPRVRFAYETLFDPKRGWVA